MRNFDATAIIVLAILLTNLRSQGLTRNDHPLSLLILFERAARVLPKYKRLTQPTPCVNISYSRLRHCSVSILGVEGV